MDLLLATREKTFKRNLAISLGLLAFIWVIYFLNLLLPVNFENYGISPRLNRGILNFIFWAFLHLNFKHLLANSLPLLVLTFLSLSFYKRLTFLALPFSAIIGGVGIWFFGRPGTMHIGASGMIFGLIGFLLFMGIFRRDPKAILVSIIVFLLYGGTILTLFQYSQGISWTGHFFGFAGGVLAAWVASRISKGEKKDKNKPDLKIVYH